VLVGKEVVAVLTYFSTDSNEPDRALMEVLAQVGTQLGRIIERQRAARQIRDREDQLRQSQKMEAMGRLAGGIAHDFNNLLTAINGYSALLLRRVEGNSILRPSILEISKAGERAAGLTGQLLAFSRKQVLTSELLDLNRLVQDMDKMFARLIGEDIELSMELAPELGVFKANRGQIEQVLMNLVVNARDAMPKGGTVRIRTQNELVSRPREMQAESVRPGRYIVLAVSDDGLGMDAETRRRIFEPFYTTKPLGEGTGLGLSTVFGIVKQSGGYIDVQSEPGKGSTFLIYFPAMLQEGIGEAVMNGVHTEPARGSETILLVEDDDSVRKLTFEILSDMGYTVLEAGSGQQALERCKSHSGPIDLLLTDVVMARMNGRELAEKILELRPGIKIVYMSGYTDDAILRRGVETSGLAFITKPFAPEALTEKIREVLQSRP
jgi:signal transduction histidine kinase/CheY-like chemotaxis protein